MNKTTTTRYELSELELQDIIRKAVADGIEEYEMRRAGKEVLTAHQVAFMKKVSVTTVRRAIKAKELPHHYITKIQHGIYRKDAWAWKPRRQAHQERPLSEVAAAEGPGPQDRRHVTRRASIPPTSRLP